MVLGFLALVIPPARGEGEALVKPVADRFKHDGSVNAVALSADGKFLATGAGDNRVHVWELATGKEIGAFPLLKQPVYAVAFAPDGKTLVSGGADKTVRIWQLDPIKELQKIEMKEGTVDAVVFSPDGKQLASAGGDKIIHLWDPEKGKEVRPLKGHENGVTSLGFSPNGKQLVSGSKDRTVRVWDVDAGKELCQYKVHQGWVLSVAFTPDGQAVASSSRDQSIIWYDVIARRQLLRVQTYDGAIPAIAFSPDGKVLASGSKDQKIHFWDTYTGKDMHQVAGVKGLVAALAFSKDGKTLAAGGDDGSAAAWDAEGLLKVAGPRKEDLAAKDLVRLWNDLAGNEEPAAYRALQMLTANPKRSVEFLGNRLKAPMALDSDKITKLLSDLANEDFGVREKATEELLAGGELVEKALRNALKNKSLTIEAKRRVEQILSVMEDRPKYAEQRRRQGALEVLERIGTAEAKDILKTLAGGPAEADITKEAKTALERMEQRAAAKP
jgi:roadblock/LC7 domain-containing protein